MWDTPSLEGKKNPLISELHLGEMKMGVNGEGADAGEI
jgi:hypothetical protein